MKDKKKKFLYKSDFTPGTIFTGGTVNLNKIYSLDLGDSKLNHVFKISSISGLDLVMDVQDYYMKLFCHNEKNLIVTKIKRYKDREYYYCVYDVDFDLFDVRPYSEPVTYEVTVKVDVSDSGCGPFSTIDVIKGASFREGNWYVGILTLDYVIQQKYNVRVYHTVMDFEKEEIEDYSISP